MGDDSRKKAAIFVDFEHWYFAMKNNFNMVPNIRAWRDQLLESYRVAEMMFFADFSQRCLSAELQKIREATNTVIETKDASEISKKDYTDFIMLDAIYQKSIVLKDVDTFIIFTGDGHFSSVINFLRNQQCKDVGVYGVKGSFSNQLKNLANWYVELPQDGEEERDIFVKILKNLIYLEERQNTYGRAMHPTFWRTIDAVSDYHGLDKIAVENALKYMIRLGYIYNQTEIISRDKTISILRVDWDLARKDGLCDYQPNDSYYSQSFAQLRALKQLS